MSEKQVQVELHNILISNNFNKNNIFYNLSENEILRDIFKNASKNNTNNPGFPDLIYFANNTLLIFECKQDNIIDAVKDSKHYVKKIIKNEYIIKNNIKIYCCGFISINNYKIYELIKKDNVNYINKLKNKLLILSTFNLELKHNINMNMNKEIHNINNYIRDNTKISNEDKSLFIAFILIGLKNNIIVDNIIEKDEVYPLLKIVLNKYNIDESMFNFLKNNLDTIHLYNILTMVNNIYKQNPSVDLLNEFYSEFVKYSNTDSKSLGIVLTPPHIVELMVKMLNITEDDIVLDLCTGTGSFLLEALKYNPKHVIGCEYQNKLYTLLKCNMVIRDILKNKYTILLDDCFNNTFNVTKSIINPPYGMKDKKELEFILKQIDSLDDNGEACAIIPISKISNNNINNRFKKQLLTKCIIKNIIICRDTLFYPVSVQTCIIHIKKCIDINNLTNIINYENDGYKIVKQHGIIKQDNHIELFNDIINNIKKNNINNINEKKLIFDDDWILNNNKSELNLNIIIQNIKLKELEIQYQKNKNNIKNTLYNINNIQIKYKKFLLIDLFDNISSTSISLKDIKDNYKNDVTYNVISSSSLNNGIYKYKYNNYTYEPHCLTLAKNGSVGYCFYQFEKFNKTIDIIVLKSKNDITMNCYIYFSYIITDICIKNFNYSYKINNDRLMKIELNLPVNDNNEIDYNFIENLYNL